MKDSESKMPIRITDIEIKNCGPIVHFNEPMSPLTLIYAGNEKGKTTIVENIIASLFRKQKNDLLPPLRDAFVGSARIAVSGIAEKPVIFNPDRKDKIDSILEKSEAVSPLPRSLFNLLFVKGAETEIIQDHGGISKTVLKSLLSRQQIYDTIEARLPPEIGYTDMVDGKVIPKMEKGKYYKQYKAAGSALRRLRELSGRFHDALSRTAFIKLQKEKGELEARLQELERAKRYHAFRVSREIDEIRRKLAEIDDETVGRIDGDINEYFRLQGDYADRKNRREQYEDVNEKFIWIEQAAEQYKNSAGKIGNPLQKISLVAAGIATVASVLSYCYKPEILLYLLGAAALSLAGALIGTFFTGLFGTDTSSTVIINEIRADFEERFNRACRSVADFETARREIERKKWEQDELDREMNAIDATLRELRSRIELSPVMSERGAAESEWKGIIDTIKAERARDNANLRAYRERLNALHVDESDYIHEPASLEYSRAAEREVEERIRALERELEAERSGFDEIRNRLREHIGSDIVSSDNLEAISIALDEKIREHREAANDSLATIIAGHVVSGIVSEFKAREDEQLEEYINTPEIRSLLKRFTGLYDRLSIDGEDIIVAGEEGAYPLRDMSTGAQEQILLALRIGIARALTGEESLFLILDDAFQYSDWKRRQQLIERVIELVSDGWQVLYFSMDDDVSRRFEEAGKKMGKGMFRKITL